MMLNRVRKPSELIDWVLDFNPNSLTHAPLSDKDITQQDKHNQVKKVFASAHWRVTASGFATGLLANPITALPAATVDFAVTLKAQIIATAQVALIYDPNFFDYPNTQTAKWALLIPVLNLDPSFFQKLEGYSGNVSHKAMMTYLNNEKFAVFRKGVLGYLAMAIAKKGALTKALPIVGSLVGTSWNAFQLKQVQNRVIDYFEKTHDAPTPLLNH